MKKAFLPLALCFLFLFANQTFAEHAVTPSETSVAYAGIKEKGIAFDVKWTNLEGNTEVIIKDKVGNIVYRSLFNEATMKKRFYLPKDDNEQYSFQVINGKNRYEKKFIISTSYVEQVQVNEIK